MSNPRAELEHAITNAIEAIPTHWVVVAADFDGSVHSLCSPGMPDWQRKGLLEWDATAYNYFPPQDTP